MGIVNDKVRLRGPGFEYRPMYDMRIHGLGQLQPSPFPVGETVGAVASTGILIGGLIVKKTPGMVMAVVGGVGLLTSGALLVIRLASRPSTGVPGLPAPTAAPPPPPPPPPKPPSESSYSKYAEYAKAFAPLANQLFSAIGLKGFARQPALMVVR